MFSKIIEVICIALFLAHFSCDDLRTKNSKQEETNQSTTTKDQQLREFDQKQQFILPNQGGII